MTTTETPVDNGVNVEALLGVRDALPETPQIAQFQRRSTVSRVNGTHSRSEVESFYRPRAFSTPCSRLAGAATRPAYPPRPRATPSTRAVPA